MNTDILNPFENALHASMMDCMHKAKKEGTTAMSIACFRQCVKPPSTTLPNAPSQQGYPQVFANVIQKGDISLRRFTYP